MSDQQANQPIEPQKIPEPIQENNDPKPIENVNEVEEVSQQKQKQQIEEQRPEPMEEEKIDQQQKKQQQEAQLQQVQQQQAQLLQAHEQQMQKQIPPQQQESNHKKEQIKNYSQAYINRLQQKVQNFDQVENECRKLRKKFMDKEGEMKQITTNNRQQIAKASIKVQYLEKQVKSKSHQIQKLTEINQKISEQLEQFKIIGDINILKEKISDLSLLNEVQVQQLYQLKNQIQKHDLDYSQQKKDLKMIEELEILEQYQKALKDEKNLTINLTQQKNLLIQSNQFISTKCDQLEAEIEQMHKKYQGESQLIFEKNQVNFNGIRQQQSQKIAELELKIGQLQQKLSENQKFNQKHQPQDKEFSNFNSLSLREQKDLILRQYLHLQTRNSVLEKQIKEIKVKFYGFAKEVKEKQGSLISKKSYNDLMIKYKNMRNCLEGAFKKINHLQSQLQHSEENKLSHIHDGVTSQQQAIINQIVQESQSRGCQQIISNFSQKIIGIEQRISIINLKEQIKQKQQQNDQLIKKIESLDKNFYNLEQVSEVLYEDIQFKKRLLVSREKIIDSLKTQMIEYVSSEQIRKQLLSQRQQRKQYEQLYKAGQCKAVSLIKQNMEYFNQLSYWKKLYEKVKVRLDENVKMMENYTLKNDGIVEGIQEEEKNEEKVTLCSKCQNEQNIIEVKTCVDSCETQTDGLAEYHYKQLRQTLGILRKITKSLQQIPENNEKVKQQVIETIKKYDGLSDKYNQKHAALKRQKMENDNWRSKVKEQVKDEFQDIRELISNNRMVNALRQAKSLIEYWEKQAEENEKQNEEMVEENENEEEEKA